MLVEIGNEMAKEMLAERVAYWTDDPEVQELYETYYDDLVDEGAFDGGEFDVMAIVDNDYINWTTYGTREELRKQFDDFDEDLILAESGDLYLYNAC